MGHAGDSKTFLAVAAALMAGLVIATMLAINAKLQSALSPTVEQAGTPAIKMVPPVAAPVLQSTAAPSIANSGANSLNNSDDKAGSNSGTAAPHVVATPTPRAVTPAAPKGTAAIVPAPSNAAQLATPAGPVARAQPPIAPTPAGPVPAVIVVGPTLAIPPDPNLSAAATTTTVTVGPDWDLGDSVASTGETHQGHPKDRGSSKPDLTAAPVLDELNSPDAAAESEMRTEGNDGNGAPLF